LKIAYFVNVYPRVSHSFIRREILALERRGFEVQRLALRGWDEDLPDEEDRLERDRTGYVLRGAPWVLLLPVLRTLARSPLRFIRALRLAIGLSRDSDRSLPYHLIWLAEACRMLPWLARFGACRIHAHHGANSAEIAMLAHVLGGPPYSFTAHGPLEFERPFGLDEKTRRAAFVVAVSEFTRSQLYLRCRHDDWPKVRVVHCGLERKFHDIPPRPIPAAPRFVCVGRICASKGQLLLIEAAARLVARRIPFELVLVGDGPMRGEVESLIDRHHLGKQVRISGWLSGSAVREQILASRALVLPTFAEGLPVVIMEAMALRRPVLTTYIAGIPELVRDRRDGWLIPAGSVEELAKAMTDCLSRPLDELEAMGDAAHRRVLERHSIDTAALELARLFGSEGTLVAKQELSLGST
jgi:colanic acid/amylovoran biosynthesis glycosyltransferase